MASDELYWHTNNLQIKKKTSLMYTNELSLIMKFIILSNKITQITIIDDIEWIIPYLYSRSNVAAAIINDSIPMLGSESIELW